MNLNLEQQQAVDHGGGALMVLAPPGSGKTRVIVNRVAKLLERGVPPEAVTLMTFTRKAAGELQERLAKLVGDDAERISAGTFHSFGYRLLKEHLNGAWREFGVVDDPRRPIGKQIRALKLKLDTQDVASNIMLAQQRLLTPDVYKEIVAGDIRREDIAKVYEGYTAWKYAEHKIDYGDMVPMAIQLLEQPAKLALVRRRCQHLLVDEGHDVSYDQLQLVYRLVGSNGNVTLVADPDQTIYCVAADSQVQIEQRGVVSASSVSVGERILARAPKGDQWASVHRVWHRYAERALRITLETGVRLTMTHSHRLYATAESVEGSSTYLMWRAGYGFRAGVTGSKASRWNKWAHWHNRAHLERADRVWVLGCHASEEEALLEEARVSLRYGIPTQIYQSDRVRTLAFVQALFGEFGGRGATLLEDRHLAFEFPTWSPMSRDGKSSGSQRRIRLQPVAWKRYGAHRVTLETRDPELREIVHAGGFKTFHVANRRRGTTTHRLQRDFKTYAEARAFTEVLADHLRGRGVNVIIDDGYNRGSIWFRLMLAANLVPGMLLDTAEGPRRITTVEEVDGGEFVDLEVPDTGNFYVNTILSHNSFRGSDVRFIQAFRELYPRHRMIALGENYRSTPQILAPALSLIRHNTERIDRPLTTRNPAGDPVGVWLCEGTDDEAHLVVNHLTDRFADQWGDCAILYRCNAQALALESALFEAEVPFSIVGGKPFFELSEVKMLLAYLRLARNPLDDVALKTVLNIPPRYLGPEFLNALQMAADHEHSHLYQALDFLRPPRPFQRQKTLEFKQLIERLRYLSLTRGPAQILREIRGPGGFDAWLTAESDGEPDNERGRNVDELTRVSERWTTIGEFLQHVMAVSKASKGKGNRVSLLTLHRSKGLEWPRVAITGLCQGVCPHEKATWAPGGLEEERRLFYVGMTRAMKTLNIYVPERMWRKSMDPSQFLYEAGLLDA